MAYDESLAERVLDALRDRRLIEPKQMFGGIAFLLQGNMCACVWKEFLIVRLGPEAGEQTLREAHVRPFDITGKPMKGWVMIEPAATLHSHQVKAWVDRAVSFVLTLPAK